MRRLWPQLASWINSGEPFALATVVSTDGSAPRAPGACMALTPNAHRFLGSVTSGCLDAEIVDAARECLATGSVRELRFGPDAAPPWTDGLTCGGWIQVRVEPWWEFQKRPEPRKISTAVARCLANDEPAVVLSRGDSHLFLPATEAGQPVGDTDGFSAAAKSAALAHLDTETPPRLFDDPRGEVFIRTLRRRPKLLVVGGPDVAAHLVAFASQAGFATTVVDPRQSYLGAERFPTPPDKVVRGWPQVTISETALGPRDVGVAVTHDPKIDDIALLALLETNAGYIGALGSSRSHARRLERLRPHVASATDLNRIHGPAGIHLGTPDAAGIASGILAGILQWQADEERKRSTAAPR